MPGCDRTGPMGNGPMTGRQAGYCGGNSVRGKGNRFFRRNNRAGFGRGRGMGPGPRWGRGQFPGPMDTGFEEPVSPGEEIRLLREEARGLQSMLEQVNKRLTLLEKSEEAAKKD